MHRILLLIFGLFYFSACSIFSPSKNSTPDPTRFAAEIDEIAQIPFDNKAERIVFTGSSSIRFWKDVPTYYPDYQVINAGFGGSQMSDLAHYLEETVLRFAPKQVFIYEGDNDVAAQQSVGTIMKHTKKVIRSIHTKFPDTEIVLIAAKPSIARWHLKGQFEALNAAFKNYAARQNKVKFADVWHIMLDEQGMVLKDIFIKDGLHMNEKGYQLWDNVLRPLVGFEE